MTNKHVLDEVLSRFCTDPSCYSIRTLGHGNINDTYLVKSATRTFVLQRINSSVFQQPLAVIKNFQKVSTHLSSKAGRSDHQVHIADPVYALNGDLFCRDSAGEFWRGQTYLSHTSCRVLTGNGQARQVGETLAAFHLLLNDLDIQSLADPLPGFHNLPFYMEDFDRVRRQETAPADYDGHYCLETIEHYRERAVTLENAKRAGVLYQQPIHGDPKLDNFVFDEHGKVIGLLDLDTVGVGLVHYDLGDCLRSCCNRAGEDGTLKTPITFDLEICRSILAGYFSVSEKLLSKKQRTYIFDGLLLICFELGLRFFTDHLKGNSYFKVAKDGDNLLRAIKQFRLTEDIAQKEEEIRAMQWTQSSCK